LKQGTAFKSFGLLRGELPKLVECGFFFYTKFLYRRKGMRDLINKLKFTREDEIILKSPNKKMLDVVIALLPAVTAGIYFYKFDALKIILASIFTSILCDAVWNYGKDKKFKVKDLSSIVTGLIFALILPSHLPVWIVVIGAIFSNVFVKSFFGGIGGNFMNPAAAGKVFLITSWAAVIAKPSREGTIQASTLMEKFLGSANGNLGEASVLALLIGFLFLLLRGVIRHRSTISYLVFFTLFNWIFSREGYFIGDYTNVINGAVVLAAVFMANDYVTIPKEKLGQVIFGGLTALLASIIMIYGYNPDGPYYAIIITNLFTPVIDYVTRKKDVKEVIIEA
jgi:Na+-translocating ferredoxin:NAD+ oxidoreductase subunit D